MVEVLQRNYLNHESKRTESLLISLEKNLKESNMEPFIHSIELQIIRFYWTVLSE